MKILIIGCNGFIGKAASSYLAEKGHDVFGCDIADDKKKNYFCISSISPDFNSLFQNNKFDVCINASGAANVSFSMTEPFADYTLNTSNVFLMLDAIRKNNASCKYINFSSAAVYGNPQRLPIDESLDPKPISPYGWHKYQSELICREFYEIFKVPTCSLRIFSAYGPGLKKQLFWDLYQKANEEIEIKLFGTGNESRDFIYVDDLIKALEIVILKGKFNGESMNVSSGVETTVKTAAKNFFDQLGKGKKYSFSGEEKKGDPNNWRADISKISALGFAAEVSFEKGIEKYVKWLKEEK